MFISRMIGDKRRWREYKARTRNLPENYRAALEAIERYLMYQGGVTNAEIMLSMNNDLLELFERAAADGTPIRAVVGDDPVEFVETFLQNYADGQWINKERERLTRAIDQAAGDDPQAG